MAERPAAPAAPDGGRTPLALVRLVDPTSGVVVHVLGAHPSRPGDLDVVVEVVGAVRGSWPDVVSRADLAEWESGLDELARGRPVSWRDGGGAVALRVTPWASGDGVDAHLWDEARTGVEVSLPVRVGPGWVEQQRRLLAEVLAAHP